MFASVPNRTGVAKGASLALPAPPHTHIAFFIPLLIGILAPDTAPWVRDYVIAQTGQVIAVVSKAPIVLLLGAPLVAIAKVICDRVEGLKPLGELLGH